MKKLVFIIIMVLFGSSLAFAGTTVEIEWDAHPETDIKHYSLYQGSVSGGYTFHPGNEAAVILFGTETVILPNLPDGTYFWVLTATDNAEQEGAPSNEVTKILDAVPGAPTGLIIRIIIQ